MLDTRINHHNWTIRLVRKSQEDMQFTVKKTKAAQEVYLTRNIEMYDEIELQNVRYFLNAFLYKYQLANFSLEQLWGIRDSSIERNMLDIARNSIVTLELSNDELFLTSHNMEQFLFQMRSCLDFYMLYLVHFLRTKHEGSISTTKFYQRLKNANPENLRRKAVSIDEHFKKKVFSADKQVDILCPTNWGSLVKSLRDKIAHKDKINFSRNSSEKIMHDILLDFPTLQELTVDRFCQSMENGMWFMIHDLFPVLYELEWKAGPYRAGMFEYDT